MTDFDMFIKQALCAQKPQRMLCCFVETKPVWEVFPNDPRPGLLVRVVATGIEHIVQELDLELFKLHARAISAWDMVAVALAITDDGSPPSVEQCKEWLTDMESKIVSGATTGIVFFDSKGNAMLSDTVQRDAPKGTNLH